MSNLTCLFEHLRTVFVCSFKSKERTVGILQSLDDVGSTILSRTLVGEKPRELLARSISLLVSREEPDLLAGSVLLSRRSSFTFPSSADLFDNATKFVDSQVCLKTNKKAIFVWHD